MSRNSRYRILFVSAPFSGVEVYFRNLERMVRRTDEIDPHWIWIEQEQKKLPSYFPRLNWSVRASIVASHRIRKFEEAGMHFDVAFFNHLAPLTFLERFRRRVPTLISLDATPALLQEYREWYRFKRDSYRPWWVRSLTQAVTRRSYNDAALIIAWSERVKESLVRRYRIDPDKIRIVPPGVDLQFWHGKANIRDSRSGPKRPIRLLFVGGDFRRKGGDLLLKLAGEKIFQKYEFHFVTRSFSGTKPPNVFVHENVIANSSQMFGLYQNADIAVLPTRADFTPLAICEAMAMRLPVISTGVGNIREMVIDGKTGYLIAPDDLDSLRDSLKKLAADATLRRGFGRNGRALAEERFNLERNSREVIGYLKEVADRGRPWSIS